MIFIGSGGLSGTSTIWRHFSLRWLLHGLHRPLIISLANLLSGKRVPRRLLSQQPPIRGCWLWPLLASKNLSGKSTIGKHVPRRLLSHLPLHRGCWLWPPLASNNLSGKSTIGKHVPCRLLSHLSFPGSMFTSFYVSGSS